MSNEQIQNTEIRKSYANNVCPHTPKIKRPQYLQRCSASHVVPAAAVVGSFTGGNATSGAIVGH